MEYNPFNWYWLADDARVFAGDRQQILNDADAAYSAWLADGNYPSTWPRDLDGNQTEAALQEVLQPYSMFANLKYYTYDKRWRTEQGGTIATAGFPIRTNDRAQAKITGLYAASKESPAVATPYHAADNSIQQLDAAGMYQLNVDLLTHINNCFAVSADMVAGIDDGSITTREQIDAAFDAPITQARRDWLKK